MIMDKWVEKNLGKSIDYDGVYGVQCVDLIKHFVKNVLLVEPQSIGNAIEYYRKRKTSSYLKTNFKWISNSAKFIPQKGDLCVFTSKSGNGHISVATGEGTTSYFYSYDQNYPSGKHEPMTRVKHSYASFLGVLRPKFKGTIINAPTVTKGKTYKLTAKCKVYKNFRTDSGAKKVSQLTADGRKNAYKKGANDTAILKKRTKVTVKNVKRLSSGNLWIEIPSGFILIWNAKKKALYIK